MGHEIWTITALGSATPSRFSLVAIGLHRATAVRERLPTEKVFFAFLDDVYIIRLRGLSSSPEQFEE